MPTFTPTHRLRPHLCPIVMRAERVPKFHIRHVAISDEYRLKKRVQYKLQKNLEYVPAGWVLVTDKNGQQVAMTQKRAGELYEDLYPPEE